MPQYFLLFLVCKQEQAADLCSTNLLIVQSTWTDQDLVHSWYSDLEFSWVVLFPSQAELHGAVSTY